MFAKIWKKLLLAVLLITCLFNITLKIVQKSSLEKELNSSLAYMQEKETKK